MPAVSALIVGSFSSGDTIQSDIPISMLDNTGSAVIVPAGYRLIAFVAGAAYAGAFAAPDPTWTLIDPPQITAHGFTAAAFTKIAGAAEPNLYDFSQGGPGSTNGYVSGVVVALPASSIDAHIVNAAFAPSNALAATATAAAPTIGDYVIAVLATQNGSDSAGVGSNPNPAWTIDAAATPHENALLVAHLPNTAVDNTSPLGFAASTGAMGGDFLGFLIFCSPGNTVTQFSDGDILRNSASVVVSSGSVQLTASAPNDGSPPYTYAWYRSTVAPFSQDTTTALAGQSGLQLVDATVVAGQRYYYVFEYTDSAGNVTDSLPQLVVVPSSLELVGVIGDGIGYGLGTQLITTAQAMGNAIAASLATAAAPKTCGILNSSVPQATTENWLPGGSYLAPAIETFIENNVQYVVVALGTEDARDDVNTAPLDYLANLRSICEYIATEIKGVSIVVMFPPPIDVGRAPAPFSVNSLARLAAYLKVFPQIATGGVPGLTIGDSNSWTYFGFSHLDQLSVDGVHPNDLGAAALGALWAKAVLAAQATTALAPTSTTVIALTYPAV